MSIYQWVNIFYPKWLIGFFWNSTWSWSDLKVKNCKKLRLRKTKHCMKIRVFVLRRFVKRTEKIIFSVVLVCFLFTEISYFLNFPSSGNVRKQLLFANAYSCVKMKFSVVLLRKQTIFHLRLGQLFADDN